MVLTQEESQVLELLFLIASALNTDTIDDGEVTIALCSSKGIKQ